MTKSPLTALDIYKKLPQTNCGKCQLPSCLAFAAAIVAGSKKVEDCPDLSPESKTELLAQLHKPDPMEIEQALFVDKLQKKIGTINLETVAPLIGARVENGRIIINSLGKDFTFDRRGNMTSECHIISWVQAPMLSYITYKTHADITGNWISFREIKGGIEWQTLFANRCEEPLRRLADDNPGLLNDLIDLFMGETIDWYDADIALILHPLPKFPILICYQAPEDDLESKLTIFFDECCGINLHIKSIFTLCYGLVQMFTKIAEHHL
jgi:hypothetical protein